MPAASAWTPTRSSSASAAGDEAGDPADLGGGGVLLGLRGAELAVGGVGRRRGDGERGGGGADEHGTGQDADEQRAAAGGPRRGRREPGRRGVAGPDGRREDIARSLGKRVRWAVKLRKSRTVTSSHKGNTRHNGHAD